MMGQKSCAWRSADGRWGADFSLTEQQISELKNIMSTQATRRDSTLSGRGGIRSGVVTGIGKVVAKEYLRGGLLRRFVGKHFLRWGASRPEREFDLIKTVCTLGVNAPEPVAFHSEGFLLYRGWLFTREIENYRNLVDVSKFTEEQIAQVIHELGRQLEILILNHIFHIDLHPGNVLIDAQGKIYVLDFDKATLFRGPTRALRELYIRRWRRAVIKHRLPDTLSELMCIRLREVAVAHGNK